MPVVVNFFRKCPLLHNFSRDPYCIYNFYISGTTAIIVTQGIFDFFISGLFIHIQKSFRAHYHARNAKAALYSTSLSVCIRIYLFFPLCQTFYCNDISAIQQILSINSSFFTSSNGTSYTLSFNCVNKTYESFSKWFVGISVSL